MGNSGDYFLHGCCDDGQRIDFSKATFPNPFWYVYWDWDFTITALWFIAYPIYWIFVSQLEYRTGILRKFFGGAYIACGLFALTLLPISLYRDCRFITTVRRQAPWWLLRQNPVLWTGHVFVLLGLILVITSFRLLGLWATLLGDYFRIHEYSTDVRHRFPYTWFHHPMYYGATFIFFGFSLVMASQAGLVLALLAMIMYHVAIYFEHEHFCQYHHGGKMVTVQQQTGEDDKDQNGGDSEQLKGDAEVQTIGAAQSKIGDEQKKSADRKTAPDTDGPQEDEETNAKVKGQGDESEETVGEVDSKKER